MKYKIRKKSLLEGAAIKGRGHMERVSPFLTPIFGTACRKMSSPLALQIDIRHTLSLRTILTKQILLLQSWTFPYIQLLKKHYENEVTLRLQN